MPTHKSLLINTWKSNVPTIRKSDEWSMNWLQLDGTNDWLKFKRPRTIFGCERSAQKSCLQFAKIGQKLHHKCGPMPSLSFNELGKKKFSQNRFFFHFMNKNEIILTFWKVKFFFFRWWIGSKHMIEKRDQLFDECCSFRWCKPHWIWAF